ncbi:MAG: hypothetical protein HW421_2049 [Ignavibacteria bacterium]|nr:hypothetical protein [Ignavibacteria bacterium]
MLSKSKNLILFFIILAVISISCKDLKQKPAESAVSKGKIIFSGVLWKVNNDKNISLDENGWLHIKLTAKDSGLTHTEIVSDTSFGFGEFTLTLGSDFTKLPNTAMLTFSSINPKARHPEDLAEIGIRFLCKDILPKDGNILDCKRLMYYTVSMDPNDVFASEYYPEFQGGFSGGSIHKIHFRARELGFLSSPGNEFKAPLIFGNINTDKDKTPTPIKYAKPGMANKIAINLRRMKKEGAQLSDVEFIIKKFTYIRLEPY